MSGPRSPVRFRAGDRPRRAVLPGAAGAGVLILCGGAATAQPTNHIGGPMAEILIGNGCAMAQGALADTMQAQGWHISDFQAQATALMNDRYLTSDDGGTTLKLVNWEPCN